MPDFAEIIAHSVVRRSASPTGTTEWLDHTIVADTPSEALKKAADQDAKTPSWAARCPVIRAAKVRINIVEEKE